MSTTHTTFLVAFTGGYEPPSYQAFTDEDEAWGKAEEWASDMAEGDTIDVLKIVHTVHAYTTTATVERLHADGVTR